MAEAVTVTWEWRSYGFVTLDGGKLVFPRVPRVPGVYRLTFLDPASATTGVYLGEADLLPRRFQHYRTPGVSQQTNQRLNPLMTGTLESGGRVLVEVADSAEVVTADGPVAPLDLAQKSGRVLVERAAEVAERAAGTVVLNK